MRVDGVLALERVQGIISIDPQKSVLVVTSPPIAKRDIDNIDTIEALTIKLYHKK